MKLKTVTAILVFTLFTAMSFAQAPAGNARWLTPMIIAANPEALLQRSDVRDDLDLSDDQKSQLNDIGKHIGEGFRNLFMNQDQDEDARQAAIKSLTKEATDETDKILTDGQKRRLREIALQLTGNIAATNQDIQKAIGLSEEQRRQINDLRDAAAAAGRSVVAKVMSGELTWDQIPASNKKNAQILDDKIGEILTPAQKVKMKALSGRHFEQTDPTAKS